MAEFITESDIVDFEGFEDVVDRLLLRKAETYLEQILAEFAPAGRGIEMFSTKLRGGLAFRRGELTCWAGYNGHRKSMFTGQLVLDLIAQKTRVMMASFEMQPSRTLARMAKQAWGRPDPTPEQIAVFTRWTGDKLWMFDHVGRLTPRKCLAMCRHFSHEKHGHHVVIDSMMMVCGSEESMDEQKQLVTDLVRLAVERNLHIHLVTHCRKPQHGEDKPPGKYDLRGSSAISDQAHNVVTIWANQAKKAKLEEGCDPGIINEPDALITVEKQRNGRWEGRCKLWFDEQSMRFADSANFDLQPYAGLQ